MKVFHRYTKMTLLPLVLLATTNLRAGPPFQTDDPEPIEFRHYEVYRFGATDGPRSKPILWVQRLKPIGGLLPTFISYRLPLGAIRPSNNPLPSRRSWSQRLWSDRHRIGGEVPIHKRNQAPS